MRLRWRKNHGLDINLLPKLWCCNGAVYFVKRGWKKSVSKNIGGWGWGYGQDEGDDLAVEWLLDLATVDQTILESSDIPITHAGSIHDEGGDCISYIAWSCTCWSRSNNVRVICALSVVRVVDDYWQCLTGGWVVAWSGGRRQSLGAGNRGNGASGQ